MPNTQLQHILYVEDDEALARLLQKRMERQRFKVDIAYSAEEGLDALNKTEYDLILIDYKLPGKSGLEMLDDIFANYQIPTIILTASGDEGIALSALEKGAADYAVKDVNQTYLDLLPAVMQAAYTKERLMRINEQQQEDLKEAVKKAEAANQAKSNFLATMSHEIRTPMNVVIGLSRMLTRTKLDEDQLKIVTTLQNNADLLLKLINDLLDISRIEAGQIQLEMEPFNLSSLLEEIEMMFEGQIQEKNLYWVLNDNTQGQYFLGDRTRLQQIIMNLVSNAIKFTEKGGIELTADIEYFNDNECMVSLKVRDTGIGIAEEKLPLIFKTFTQADETITRRFGGSGLGLSIAVSLANLMGGDISVKTTEGEGSIFNCGVKLSIKNNTLNENNNILPDFFEVINESTILLVEDYKPNIMVVTLMLEDIGCKVITAETGFEAIEKVQNTQTPFLAILMDVQMYGMDGLETTRRIRAIEKKMGIRNTIIGVTAHAMAGDRQRCLEAGMDDYISKPIYPEILKSKLTQLLEVA